MGQKALDKKKAKAMQKAINALQSELGKEIMEIFTTAKKPLDLAEIIALYPQNERREKSNEKELKQYIQMGLGPMVQNGILKQLPIDSEGKHRLELV